MINIYLIVLFSIVTVSSVFRAFQLRSMYIGVMSSILSILLTAMVSYLTLYQAFIQVNDYILLRVIFGSIILFGFMLSLVKKENKVIIHIALSNTVFIFVLFLLPMLIAFDSSSNAKIDFLKYGLSISNIIGVVVLYLIYFGALLLNFYLGKTKGILQSNIYSKDIENTFYPINYYGLFIVAVSIVAISSITFDTAQEIDPIKGLFYRDIENVDTNSLDSFNGLSIYSFRDADATGPNTYDTCVFDYVSSNETCIDTNGFTRDLLSTQSGLYFVVKNDLYYYHDEVITKLIESDEIYNINEHYLYFKEGKTYFETDTAKWELNANMITEVNEFTPLSSKGEVLIKYGHVLINTFENTTIIDGVEYEVNVPLKFIKFFENRILSGKYEFLEGSAILIGDNNTYTYQLDGEFYRRVGRSDFSLFVNIDDDYDVIRYEDTYSLDFKYNLDEDGYTYIGELDYNEDYGVKLNIQAQYPYVSFSVFWTFVLYFSLSALYFVVKKETYRIR